jgi:hypothetical protein
MNLGFLTLGPQLMLLPISTAFPSLSLILVPMLCIWVTGTCLNISHIGSTFLSTSDKPLLLTNVLHISTITKKLLSIHQLTKDNNVLVKFTSNSYFIKKRLTKKTILIDILCNGLYALDSDHSPSCSLQQVLQASQLSTDN